MGMLLFCILSLHVLFLKSMANVFIWETIYEGNHGEMKEISLVCHR